MSKDEILKKLNIELKYKPLVKFNSTGNQTFDNCVFAVFNSDSFEESIYNVLSYGGDTDTNAAIAGALLGAWLGPDAIPRPWLAAVHAANPPCYTALLPTVDSVPGYPRAISTIQRNRSAQHRLSGVAPIQGFLGEEN